MRLQKINIIFIGIGFYTVLNLLGFGSNAYAEYYDKQPTYETASVEELSKASGTYWEQQLIEAIFIVIPILALLVLVVILRNRKKTSRHKAKHTRR